ncbi:MAG: head GIN domain-containing protein [Flavobacteriales bacterium]
MKNLKLNLAVVMMAALSLGSCKKVILDAGDLTIENREINDDFTEIQLKGSIDLYINDDSDELRVEAGENVISHIETFVQNGVLHIEEESNNFLTTKPRRVYVNINWLDKLKTDGSGDVDIVNLNSGEFNLDTKGSGDVEISFDSVSTVDVDLDGSGDVKVTGQCNSIVLGVNGSGDINSKQMNAESAVVNVNGSGDVDVTATESLIININGSGDVTYWGNPSNTEFNTNGSGDISGIN